jgi:AraC family transcriptional regulator of adaptative response/methylated-DNA-[protein]-cysteine methyltransferase
MRKTIHLATVDSPIGILTVGEVDGRVVLLAFGDVEAAEDEIARIRRALAADQLMRTTPVLAQLKRELAEYFAGDRREFTVPLHPVGTSFQQTAWQGLLEIPYGATRSYAQLAESIGHPRAVRAVGSANGRNPISILIPCHRVIASGGGLGGYGGGLDRKRLLLDLETRVAGTLSSAV